MTVLVLTGAGVPFVEVFEPMVGMIDGSRVVSLVRRSYEVERFAFEVFEPILGLSWWNE